MALVHVVRRKVLRGRERSRSNVGGIVVDGAMMNGGVV